MLLAGRCQFARRHHRGSKAVLQTEPDCHLRLPGEDAIAKHLALQRLGIKFDTDLSPSAGHKLQHVGLLRAITRGFDDNFQWPTVGEAANAVRPARQTDLVEQGICLVGVEAGPASIPRLIVQRAVRQHRVPGW